MRELFKLQLTNRPVRKKKKKNEITWNYLPGYL